MTPVRTRASGAMGVVHAEVIRVPQSLSQRSSLRVSASSRPSICSPLANTFFGSVDILQEEEREADVNGNPFTDEHAPHLPPNISSAPGIRGPAVSTIPDWIQFDPSQPWNDRPTNVDIRAGSVDTPMSLRRIASTSLVPPPTIGNKTLGTLKQRQQHALSGSWGGYMDSSKPVFPATPTVEGSILEFFLFIRLLFRTFQPGIPVHQQTLLRHAQRQRDSNRSTIPHSRSSLPSRGTASHPTSLLVGVSECGYPPVNGGTFPVSSRL